MTPVDQVAPGVIRIEAPLPIPEPPEINCYLLRLDDGDVLVDAGMRGSEAAIDPVLEAVGADVQAVLLTHGHPDHWGLASRFADRVVAHPGVRSQLAYADRYDPAAEMSGARVSEELYELLTAWRPFTTPPPDIEPIGDRLGPWRVLDTPGHAPGHICLYREQDGVLIAGDHLLPAITPNIHLSPESPDAVQEFMDSLARVARLDVSLVLPAHGEPFTDAAGRAKELIAHHRNRLATLERLLADGPADTARLTDVLFSRALTDPADQMMAEMETYAHLEHLRLRGRVGFAAPDRWWAVDAAAA